MVYSEIAKQAQLFALAIPVGAVLLFAYDLLRVFRRVAKHKTVGIAVEDMLFWMICALGMFAFMYRLNDGVIRGFIILGAFCGMLFYSILFSRWVVKGGTAALRFAVRIAGHFFCVITAPFRFSGRFFRQHLQKTARRNKKSPIPEKTIEKIR
ncbi:MAG: spore cortex biosynthesis protein YabQ [Lachnospiraceae bacterium]|nr:spore cortex biosynthesis protein YabQ [Lachnospiraceae bacterium]